MTDANGPSARGLLGPLEYEVMGALWASSPASVPVVLARLNEVRPEQGQLAYTTVMTVLARLHDKGLVQRERRGRGYDYTASFDEAGLVEHLGRREVQDLLERYGEVALAQFAAVIDDADEQLVRRLREVAGDHDG
jgi:predicted transcriptional regulator